MGNGSSARQTERGTVYLSGCRMELRNFSKETVGTGNTWKKTKGKWDVKSGGTFEVQTWQLNLGLDAGLERILPAESNRLVAVWKLCEGIPFSPSKDCKHSKVKQGWNQERERCSIAPRSGILICVSAVDPDLRDVLLSGDGGDPGIQR